MARLHQEWHVCIQNGKLSQDERNTVLLLVHQIFYVIPLKTGLHCHQLLIATTDDSSHKYTSYYVHIKTQTLNPG